MKKKIIIGMVLMLITVGVFAGCVHETESYVDNKSDSRVMSGSLEDLGFQLYHGKTILYVKFVGPVVPYYFFAPEHDLSGFHWHLADSIGERVDLMYTDVGLDYNYLYDVNVNGSWFYG